VKNEEFLREILRVDFNFEKKLRKKKKKERKRTKNYLA